MNEFSLIQQFFNKPQHSNAGVVLGVGDDAALIEPPQGQQLVISTDTLVAGRHFPLDTPPHAIGWKAAAVNLSDIAAMGATPQAMLLALSLPAVDEAWLAEFSRGFFECCQPQQVALVGGDTTRSPTLSISVTALGWVPRGQAIRRDGAQVGDLIVVSNNIGDAAYALRHPNSKLQQRLDYPVPQSALGIALRGFAHSMLDISDGLAQDLGHILHASAVGAVLHVDQLPFSPVLHTLDAQQRWAYALTGGDDYELCFTLSPQRLAQFYEQYAGQFSLTVIGEICRQPGLQLMQHGQPVVLDIKGYQHFD